MDAAERLADHRAALQRHTSVPIPPVRADDNLGRSTGRHGDGSLLADVCATEIRVNAAAVRDLSDVALQWTLAHEVGHLVQRGPGYRAASRLVPAAAFVLTAMAVICVLLAAGQGLGGVPIDARYVFAAPLFVVAALVVVLVFLALRRSDELRVDRWAARLVATPSGAREAFAYAAGLNTAPGWYWRPSTLLSSHPPAARRLEAIEAAVSS